MSKTQKPVIAGFPPGRITVHNATGAKLSGGTVVCFTGTQTNGKPNVEATNAIDDRAIGVLYEDIEDGEDGVCIIGDGEIVEVVVNADVTPGEYAGLSTVAGRVENLSNIAVPGAGVTNRVTIIGRFLGGFGTQAAGDKVKMMIMHGLVMQSG